MKRMKNETLERLAMASGFDWYLESGYISSGNRLSDLEQYAQHIVRECARLVRRSTICIDEYNCQDAESYLLQHFELE